MKAKKIVAIVMGTALLGTVAVGMSACTKKAEKPESLKEGTLAIADYAAKYESQYSKKAYTGIETVYSLDYSTVVTSAHLAQGYLVIKESGDKYGVMNAMTGKKILTGLVNIPENEQWGGFNVIAVNTSTTDPNEYAYYMYDGTQVLAAGIYGYPEAVDIDQYYVGNDTEKSTVGHIIIEKTVNEEPVEVEVFVKLTVDEKTQEQTFSIVKESDLKVYAPEYDKGTDHSGLKHGIYSVSETRPVDGDIKDYKFSQTGNKFTFYKGSEETGSVDLTNGEPLAFMGNSLYYTVSVAVSPDATEGYNMTALGSKVDYSLYKYDVVANTTTELCYDVIVTEMEAIYNYKTKAYDAAIISGMKISDDGVAYGSDEFAYIVNNDFELCHDVTGLLREAPGTIYDLGSDKYLVGNVIVDSELKVVSSVDSYNSRIYADQGLIGIYSDGNYGFTDLSGKVVIEPKYSGTIRFYGDVAYTTDAYSGEKVLLKKDGTVTKISDLEKSANENVTKNVTVRDGIYYITTVTTTTVDSVPTTKTVIDVYTFDGKLLKSFENPMMGSGVPTYQNGAYYISEMKTTGSGVNTKVTGIVYKIV